MNPNKMDKKIFQNRAKEIPLKEQKSKKKT
jgi:hypothetical protein